MATFQEFRNNVKKKFQAIRDANILKLRTRSIDEIYKTSSEYFNLPLESLRFEVETFIERTLIKEPEYHVIAYPDIQYSFIDAETNTIKNVNGEFFIRRGPGRIFLYVSPPEKGGMTVKFEEVWEKVIHTRHVPNDIEQSFVKKIVDDAESEWIIIARFEHMPENDANIQIKVSDDLMQAEILIEPPMEGGSDVTQRAIMDVIRAVDIVYGVKEKVVDRLEKAPIHNQWIEIAVGKPAIDGDDSYIEIVPTQKGNGSANAVNKTKHEMMELITVDEGEVVVRKVLFTEGTRGQNLLGNILLPNVGNDIVMEGNEHVKISADNMEAIALVSGSVYIKNNKVFVDKIWEIGGDLSLEIGNIDFPGSVIIRGNILDDFEVKVEGNLTVLGTVGKSNLYVGGNLEVMKGINGRGEAKIEVGGSLSVKFAERVDIKVRNYCIISESIINCNIVCYNKIFLVTGRGRVSSSTVIAEKEIYVKKIGSELGSPSDIRVVSLPDERQRLEDVLERIKQVSDKIEQNKSFFGEGVTPESIKRLSENQKDHIKEIMTELKKSQKEYKRLLNVANILRKKIRESEGDVNIYIGESVKEETRITLNDISTVLKQNYPSINFFIKDGKIVNKQLADIHKLVKKNNIDKLFPYAKF